MDEALKPWFEQVRLNPDVEAGNLAMATFAIDFGGVLAGSEGVPLVYRDSGAFWRATYMTSGVKRLLEEVLTRLSGKPGDRVLQLRSPFGGGKSHVLAALYHALHDRKAFEAGVPDAKDLPNPGKVRVAGIDGEKFGPESGMEFGGTRAHTLWGALAAQLGCFDLVRKEEASRGTPGGSTVQQMLAGAPTLILMDEVLRYVERALAIGVGESNLGRQTLDFIQTLTTEAANSKRAVFIYSLQASAREAYDNVGLLSTLDHLTSREDAKREPVVGDEVLDVLKKRLLAAPPKQEDARAVAQAIAGSVTHWLTAEAHDAAARRDAQDDEISLARRLEAAYPFHVGLIDVMKQRWASLPDFQRTRGSLRFLACVMHKAKKLNKRSILIGPGDIPLEDADVRNAFFTEVGQREQFQAVLDHDLTGPGARVKLIDKQLAEQNSTLAGIRPASCLATAILMFSFVGTKREQDGEALTPGVTEKELLEVCVTPDLNSITARSVLKQLRDKCLYLHYDGVHYSFKTESNVNHLIEQEAEGISATDINDLIRTRLDERIGQATNAAYVWPQDGKTVRDKEPSFTMIYLHAGFSEMPGTQQDKVAIEMLSQCGGQPRHFRNGLGLAVPDRKPLSGLGRSAKYILAVQRVYQKRTVYHLTKEQIGQLKERETTEESGFESALRGLYPSVWLLGKGESGVELDKHPIGGRTVNEQDIHKRLIAFLGSSYEGKLFDTLKPKKLMGLLQMGLGTGEKSAVETAAARDLFFESLDFPRLVSQAVLARAIAQGMSDGLFVYALKGKARLEGERWTVKQRDLPRTPVSPDEIELDGGMLLLPECVVPDEPVVKPPDGGEDVLPPEPKLTPPPAGSLVKRIRIEMHLNRPVLYKTFNALGNLVDKTGTLKMTVEAESLDGMQPDWLRNAVEEPITEIGLEPPPRVEKS
jgi:hypothetical protein